MHPLVNKCRRLAGTGLDTLLPQYCLFCGLASRSSLPLCQDCRSELPANTPCCLRCALPLAPTLAPTPDNDSARLCGRCLAQPPAFDRVIAPYRYDPQLALLIQRWKYQPLPRLGRLAASLWQAAVPEPPAVDVLVAVPLHWRKLLRRGFNQSGQLCERLHRHHPALAHSRLARRLLTRLRATAVQAELDAAARRRNLRGAFTLLGHCDNLRVAVVDDVMTTGATASELARCLKAGGAREVQLWCLARTPAPS
ncbi:ComF family protein [Parahaliea mediterranea]|uniref:ComF family protein n=1 Tax=Parahaliea mediterranea TaxID=651086 RepID=UPI000E2E5A1D|nr:ComF family protein [Parahaliea mediterranea]